MGDEDMFEDADEDKDLESQVRKETSETTSAETARSEREDTPGPQANNHLQTGSQASGGEPSSSAGLTESPGIISASSSSPTTEPSPSSTAGDNKPSQS